MSELKLPDWATDEYLIADALYWYSRQRWAFANAVAQGAPGTKGDPNQAVDVARRVDELLAERRAMRKATA